MIEKYKNENAFNASEDLLLVPIPIDEMIITSGFAGQVIKKFPNVEAKIRERGGLEASEILIIGDLGTEERWIPAYSLALCGIHRQQQNGWKDSPAYFQIGLDTLSKRFTGKKLATAGIPGTGYSGLRGDASPEEIKAVLDNHEMLVTVYQDSIAGDREKLTYANPSLSEGAELELQRVTLAHIYE